MPRGAITEMVKVAAVARFLGKKPEEVLRMMKEDGLPNVPVPGENKPSVRIFLPDFHEWLVSRGRVPAASKLAAYDEFKRAFFAAQSKEARGAPTAAEH